METNRLKNLRIGDVLKENGYVTDEQIQAAIEYQKANRGVRLGEALVQMGTIEEDQMLQALAERIGIQVVELSNEEVSLDAVEKIPHPLAVKYGMLALDMKNGNLRVALNDPMNLYALEDVRQVTGMSLELCLASHSALTRAIQFYYAEIEARTAARIANQSNQAEENNDDMLDIALEEGDDTPIINLLNRLISRAYATNASDIHIEPFEKATTVRMRIDGSIVDYVSLQKKVHASLIARVKILSNLDIAEKRIPQDGHFRTRIDGDFVNVRVSVLPTVFGEKAVLRLLANNTHIDHVDSFGMEESEYNKVSHMLQAPHGIIYFTGPTGSGKTTTLYMILSELTKRPVNIVTIEDPVEKNIPKINQTQVNVQAGLTFASGLRSVLRQDPDIIMIGETRDMETASISVRSAITGHLVFSTLHTNDAPSSVIRLRDMGLAPYMISSSLVGIVAQRLMRKICPECKAEREAEAGEKKLLSQPADKPLKICYGKGCPSCNGTGYRGRIAIHEVLSVDRRIREMIMDEATAEEIGDYAIREQGMKTLKSSGEKLVLEGITTLEELMKVSYHGLD